MPKANITRQSEIYDMYLDNITKYINNWDLVDISAPHIVGYYLLNKKRLVLYKLAKGSLWQKRVAIISCFGFIRNNEFEDALNISELLMYEEHDLLHKAVGWMLREIGKRDEEVLVKLLNEYAITMPRTTLRYAIEKFTPELRKFYLSLKYSDA